mmetsp:Transcript_10433/g.31420  ORF Transcript_10433/g.31420 Transcript_10433/m.31420 type:complete len:114 (-) Transcript_10433:327-668(-)
MPSLAGWAVLAGFALFAIAAHTVVSSRQLAQLTQQEYSGVPLLAAAELTAAAIVLCYASLRLSGEFKPISSVNPARGTSTHNFRPDFMRFNHRGKALPSVLPGDHPIMKTGGI